MSQTKILHALKRLLMHGRRRAYALRRYIPGLRNRHRLEAMVGPLGYWDELQRYQLQVLRTAGLQPQHALLDVGCGPLQGGIAFLRYLQPGRYTGVDIDPVRLDAGRTEVHRLGLDAKHPRILQSSSFGDAELGDARFDFIWASQMLYYFEDARLEPLFRMAARRLNPGGKFLGDIFDPDHYEFRFPENPGKYVRHTPESIQALAAHMGFRARELGRLQDFGYPKRLYLRTSLLFEFTRQSA